ncbi:DUF938 domain-containing protein [Pseudoalteromonas piscicida]|uniref:Methylase n=1 Tax=Pseudoalteromonas piscicida TaxID=43662 RepID=A0A2A5JKZ5_PSEO7|nr:DUF938 domain-containing protein [Pseudoalteromonas piscicida]PCK30110.1 methylase [Pseudoalteromonas piscicida]
MTKPYSQACENNKHPILEKLKTYLSKPLAVLEIGSGTGQHAVHFAAALPHLTWQTADREVNHAGILAWLNDAGLENVLPPLALDLQQAWPTNKRYDVIYTANTLHIVSAKLVERLFIGAGAHLSEHGYLIVYGPFNYQQLFTSDSNREFDAYLKTQDGDSGIRDQEWVVALAAAQGFILQQDYAMPANNRLLVFKR